MKITVKKDILDWEAFRDSGNNAGCREGTGRCLCPLLTLPYVVFVLGLITF